MGSRYAPGINVLLRQHRRWLEGRRIGLVSHAAAVDLDGCQSADRLHAELGEGLGCLFGPEHGFFGLHAAGASCDHARHPGLDIPVYSLYGPTRKPTPEMLADVDVLVLDLQDVGVRCYTYLSTLCYVLEAADAAGCDVVVADRPIPLPSAVDGPMTEDECRSFVALADVPLCYGMTLGEAALMLKQRQGLSVRVRVARMWGYRRGTHHWTGRPPWVPPSPAMLSWESARCYPATVFAEAFGDVDQGRGTSLPFQVLGAPWTDAEDLAARMTAMRLPGVRFYPHRYAAVEGRLAGQAVSGIRLVVVNPDCYRPALTAVCLVEALQEQAGSSSLWAGVAARPAFFDQLFGTRAVRCGLQAGHSGRQVARAWRPALREFEVRRREFLLYR